MIIFIQNRIILLPAKNGRLFDSPNFSLFKRRSFFFFFFHSTVTTGDACNEGYFDVSMFSNENLLFVQYTQNCLLFVTIAW